MRALGELVGFQYRVQFPEIATMERHYRPGSQHRLVLVQLADVGVGDGKGPQEPRQSFYVTTLLQSLTHSRHLGHREVQSGQREHGVRQDGRRGHRNRHADPGRGRRLRVGPRAGPGAAGAEPRAQPQSHVGCQRCGNVCHPPSEPRHHSTSGMALTTVKTSRQWERGGSGNK